MSRIPSPQNDKRGCLYKNGKYSRRCCDGTLRAQGIGNITKSIFVMLLEDGGRILQEDNSKINI